MRHSSLSLLILSTALVPTCVAQTRPHPPGYVENSASHPALINPAWVFDVKAELGPETTGLAAPVLDARSKLFHGGSGDLDNPSNAHIHTSTHILQQPISPTPVSMSTLVVYATPVSAQPYLGDHRANVYSDVKFDVDRPLTQRPGMPVPKQFSVLYPAGSIRTATGKVVHQDFPSGMIPVSLGKTYMLFLSYKPQTESYYILSAWDVSSKVPVHIDYDGRPSPVNQQLLIQSKAELESRVVHDEATSGQKSNEPQLEN